MQTVQTSKSPEPRAACISCHSRLRPVAAVVFSVDLFQCLICTHHVRLHGFVCAMKFSSKTEQVSLFEVDFVWLQVMVQEAYQ